MRLIKYKDCIALKISDMPDREIERLGHRLSVDLQLADGHETEVVLVARPKADGTSKVMEVLLDKALDKYDLENSADLRWYVFPAGQDGRKLPPVVASWEDDGTVVAACQSERYGGPHEAYRRKTAHCNKEPAPPDPDRMLCWWPDVATWQTMKGMASHLKVAPVARLVVPYYTFSEWFARSDVAGTAYDERAVVFGRYLRRVRTTLLWNRRKGHPVEITVGNAQRAEQLFEEMGLDPGDHQSWSTVATEFEPMPDVLLETRYPCGPTAVVGKSSAMTAVINFISHLPHMAEALDCAGAALYAGKTNVVNIHAWCNPLAGADAADKALDALFAEFEKYGVKKVVPVEGELPFEACPECGGMTLRVPPDFEAGAVPVSADYKPRRNDPCPCGSGKKYKNCCGR